MADSKGQMKVGDAGRLGGQKVKAKYGPQFYERIGKMGGARIQELVREALEAEGADDNE